MLDARSLKELFRARRSVRSFAERKVEREKIMDLLEAVQAAPSSCNTQPWRLVVVDRTDLVAELAECAPVGTRVNRFMAGAPVVFVLCAQPHKVVHQAARLMGRDCHLIDIGIAGEHLCLAAAAHGLGSCWIGWFSEKSVRKLLGIPRALEVVALIPVGYPADGRPAHEAAAGEASGPNDLPVARRNAISTFAWRNRFEGDSV